MHRACILKKRKNAVIFHGVFLLKLKEFIRLFIQHLRNPKHNIQRDGTFCGLNAAHMGATDINLFSKLELRKVVDTPKIGNPCAEQLIEFIVFCLHNITHLIIGYKLCHINNIKKHICNLTSYKADDMIKKI